MCFSNDLNLSDFTVHVWNSPSLRNREPHIWKCRKASWFQKWMLKPYIDTIKANKTIKHRTWNNELFNSDDILDLLSTGMPLRSEKIIDRNSEKIMINISRSLSGEKTSVWSELIQRFWIESSGNRSLYRKSETEFEKHQKQFFDEGYSSTKWRTMKIVIATVCQWKNLMSCELKVIWRFRLEILSSSLLAMLQILYWLQIQMFFCNKNTKN